MSKSIRGSGGTVGEERGVAPAVKAFGIIAATLAIAACTPADQQKANDAATAAAPLVTFAASSSAKVAQIVAVVCKYDAIAQPIIVDLAAPVAATVVPNAAPAIAGAVALDQGVIHPAVARACPTGAQAVAGVVAGK